MRKNKKSPILDAIYEIASDLHSCGGITDEQMKKYEELAPESMKLLDVDVFNFFNKKCDANTEKMRVLINDWLRKDIEIARSVS
jgi:hypothetical protein